jgi:hypothetical protein
MFEADAMTKVQAQLGKSGIPLAPIAPGGNLRQLTLRGVDFFQPVFFSVIEMDRTGGR